MRLAGEIAVVTGAGQGIGAAIANRFAAEGAVVVAAHRDEAKGATLVSGIRDAGGTALFHPTDVTREDQVAHLMHAVVERFGGLSILCNNAGVGLLRSIVETTTADYDYIMDVNVRGMVHCCKHAIPLMIERGGGAIINLGSVASYVGFERDAVYCASKGAVLMLTRQIALDYATQGIRANVIAPGFIETPELLHYIGQQDNTQEALDEVVRAHPMGRIGQPQEVAAVAAFLASTDASFVTGTSVVVDGGLLTR